jgi:glycosyltransferase involved in cell wall biosynthesis
MATTVGVPVERITVLRNGVDLARFGRTSRTNAREALGVADDVALFGHAGRLVAVKDQAALVAAAALLKAQGRRFRVVIAGEGPCRAALEAQIAREGVEQCVQLLGHRAEVEPLYAALDAYVLCSRSEGMPNTILEAMASGVPVVSTRVGGADELVVDGETGILVPAGQPTQLAQAMAELIASPDRSRAMGRAGRARAVASFSLPAMVAGYKAAYREGATQR